MADSDNHDPEAAKRVQAILNSPGYRQADEDIDFLNQHETRGVRLQIDYLKAETLLEQAGIEHAIVLFGSARLLPRKLAEKKFQAHEAALADNPNNKQLKKELAIAKRALDNSRYYEEAREFGVKRLQVDRRPFG